MGLLFCHYLPNFDKLQRPFDFGFDTPDSAIVVEFEDFSSSAHLVRGMFLKILKTTGITIGKPKKELNACKVKMVEKHIRSQ